MTKGQRAKDNKLASIIWQDPNELRERLPVPWMRQVSTGADLRSVRLGDAQGRCYDRDGDPRKERLNLSEVEVLIQPNRLA